MHAAAEARCNVLVEGQADRTGHEGVAVCATSRPSEGRPVLTLKHWTHCCLPIGAEERGRSSSYHPIAHVSACCRLGMATRSCIAAHRSSAVNVLLPTGRGRASAALPREERGSCHCSCTKSRTPASERQSQVSAGTRVYAPLQLHAFSAATYGMRCSQLSRGKGNELLADAVHAP